MLVDSPCRDRDGGGVIDRCSDARPFPTGIASCVSSSRINSSEEEVSLVFFAGRSSILALVVLGMVMVVTGR